MHYAYVLLKNLVPVGSPYDAIVMAILAGPLTFMTTMDMQDIVYLITTAVVAILTPIFLEFLIQVQEVMVDGTGRSV